MFLCNILISRLLQKDFAICKIKLRKIEIANVTFLGKNSYI